MTFYSDLQTTATQMLAEFGQVVVFNKETVAFNAGDGSSVTNEVNYSVSAVSYPYKTKDMDGTNIKQGDIQLLMAAKDQNGVQYPAPAKGDRVTIAGVIWKIIAVEILSPGALSMMYTAQIRK